MKYEREIEKNRREGGREGDFCCSCRFFVYAFALIYLHISFCVFFYLVFLILILLFQMIFTIDGCLMRMK